MWIVDKEWMQVSDWSTNTDINKKKKLLRTLQIFVSIATELQPPNSKQNNKDASLIKVTEVKVIISSTSVCSDIPYASDLPFKQGAENTKKSSPAVLDVYGHRMFI